MVTDSLKHPVDLTILGKIIVLVIFVGETQQLVRKCLQNKNQDVIVRYISLLIYPFHFQKFCPI